MDKPTAIDRDWLAAHPLPDHSESGDKDNRGHVFVVGGSPRVPGGLRLTGEAALRAGAGRLQLATLDCLAVGLGLTIPEAAVFALPATDAGELNWEPDPAIRRGLERCDCLVVGPAMTNADAADRVVAAVLEDAPSGCSVVLDAAAIGSAVRRAELVSRREGRVVLTPNRGEMTSLLGADLAQITADPESAARLAVERTGATVILKGPRSLVATSQGELLSYEGGGIGLATGGSGDVLAGALGGLLARGASAPAACAWAVWLHGEAGRTLGIDQGPVGYLARELADLFPPLMRGEARQTARS